MDWTLEVVILPVTDIDRSVAFYRDQVGFDLDHDTKTEQMRVVQLTPRGSGCSIVFGDLPTATVLTGATIVAATGLFIVWREHQLGLFRTKEFQAAPQRPGV